MICDLYLKKKKKTTPLGCAESGYCGFSLPLALGRLGEGKHCFGARVSGLPLVVSATQHCSGTTGSQLRPQWVGNKMAVLQARFLFRWGPWEQ